MSGIEEIVVSGWINRPGMYEPYLSLSRDSHSSVFSEPLMTVSQHNRNVEQYKRDAERWAWYRLGFADPDQLDKDVDDIIRREALNQQQAEVKL